MAGQREMRTSSTKPSSSPLHAVQTVPHMYFNRVFAVVYTCGILALFYHHFLTLLHHSNTPTLFLLHLSLLLSDIILAFMWTTTQTFRFRPVKRKTYPEELVRVVDRKDFPGIDVFICTADPYKEPPMNVVNTALSVMAFDYPTDKISVYISDDGGSKLTLFAFMEAAKFASYWLPYCRENNLMDRCPEVYFSSDYTSSSQAEKLKMMYESMKVKVESVVEKGHVREEYIEKEADHQALKKWTKGFTRQDHPSVIQVLLERCKDKDIEGHGMPNLVYVAREKSNTSPHNFKSGALNVLVRVSAAMTNAPLILTQDCDMYSNDPQTPLRALCYFMDTKMNSNLGYVQFPQRFQGINKSDIYACEVKRLFQINPSGMDGLEGTAYDGTGCFFNRRAFFGGPSSLLSSDIPELSPNYVVHQSIQSDTVLAMANRVATCTYENGTTWGSKMGFQYGSIVEDYFTSYRLQREGWKSVFCNPDRAAFLGGIPITLNEVLSQQQRWAVGLLEVGFSKYSPTTFGIKHLGFLMGLSYAHYAFWAIWSIPITIYAFIPSLALLNQVHVFPKVTTPWFYLYIVLFLGAYAQDLLDFTLAGGSVQRWWNDQRMWMIRGVSSYLFGLIDVLLKLLGVSNLKFNVTSKVIDEEENKRYEQEIFDFGVASPLFVILNVSAIINLVAFMVGIARVFKHGSFEAMLAQLLMSGFVVLNCLPIYQAMALRADKGRLPTKSTVTSIFLAWIVYSVSCGLAKIG